MPLTLQQQLNQALQANSILRANIGVLQQQVQNQSSGQVPSFPTKLIVPFRYLTTFTAIPGAQAPQQPIQMAADSVFELQRIVVLTSADLPTDYAPNNCLIYIQDGSTGRYFSSNPIPQALAATRSYQYGNDEKYPIQFPANAVVNVQITNLLPATALTVNFALVGYKIFNTAPGS